MTVQDLKQIEELLKKQETRLEKKFATKKDLAKMDKDIGDEFTFLRKVNDRKFSQIIDAIKNLIRNNEIFAVKLEHQDLKVTDHEKRIKKLEELTAE